MTMVTNRELAIVLIVLTFELPQNKQRERLVRDITIYTSRDRKVVQRV